MWSLSIKVGGFKVDLKLTGVNKVASALPSGLVWWRIYEAQHMYYNRQYFWYMIHLIKPADISPYAIWRVWLEVCHAVSDVSLEVPTDKHMSTSVYKWNNYTTSYNVYISFDVAINIFFRVYGYDINLPEKCQRLFTVWFRRHFVYDDSVTQYTAVQMLEQSHFTFHNLR